MFKFIAAVTTVITTVTEAVKAVVTKAVKATKESKMQNTESKMQNTTRPASKARILASAPLLQDQQAELLAWFEAAENYDEVIVPANAKGYEYAHGVFSSSDSLRRGRLPGFLEKKTVYRMHLIGAKVDKVRS